MPKSPNYMKLRTNLRLSIQRLKLLEKKKAELALKARREIADYIGAGKDDRARIRVEHIVREDYLVEAMEIVEMFCDLLLARFGLIEKMKEMDPGLEEAIATLFWVAPRLQTDILEMKELSNQLTIKYGKEYAEMCRKNGFENVNEKVLVKMSLYAPPKLLIENYMIEIAKAYNVPFVPDIAVMEETSPAVTDDLIALAEEAANSTALENQMNEKKDPRGPGFGGGAGGGGVGFGGDGFGGGGGGGGGGGMMEPLPPFQPGSVAAHPSEVVPPPYTPQDTHSSAPVPGRPLVGPDSQPPPLSASAQFPVAPAGASGPPPLPSTPPNAKRNSQNMHSGQGGAGNDGVDDDPTYDYARVPFGPAMSQRNLPSYNEATGSQQHTNPGYGLYTIGPDVPPRPSTNAMNNVYSDTRNLGPMDPSAAGSSTGAGAGGGAGGGGGGDVYVPVLPDIPDMPSVPGDIQTGKHNSDYDSPQPRAPQRGQNDSIYIPVLPDIPSMPSVPTGSDSVVAGSESGPADDLDFDDLTKRFEALKKKK